MGVQLIAHGARRTTLTDAGRLLYKRAVNILELTRTAVKELDDFGNGLSGTLALGTVSSSGAALLTKRMIAFHQNCPNVRFFLYEGNTYQMLDLLHAGVIEVAVVRTPFPTEGFECITLEPEEVVLAGKPAYFGGLPQDEPAPVHAVQELPLILYRRFEGLAAAACEQAGIEPNILYKNGGARTMLMWASVGLGVAMVPKSVLSILRDGSLAVRALDCPQLCTQIAAIYRKNTFLSTAAKRFLEVFSQNKQGDGD